MRKIFSWNEGWKFKKTTILPEEFPNDWSSVILPHTWNSTDGQDGGNDYWRGKAIYSKAFTRPLLKNQGRAIVEFLGAAMTADVWINGQHIARHDGGYSTFRVDITDSLLEDNLLNVVIDNSENQQVYPQKADFTFYGGIYRDVNLITVVSSHFELCKDGMPGIKITPVLQGMDAIVTIETWQTGGDLILVKIQDQEVVMENRNGYASSILTIGNCRLWNGVKDPYLYTATATLKENGKVLDQISSRFGCRSFDFDPDLGFLLNGSSYPLRGVSRHQDHAGNGNALTFSEHKLDMELIKEIGANTVRLAHYQHAQEFYDLCDEEGLIVWAEIPYITMHMPEGRQNTLDQMRELVTQCYNHPSIICWGLSNEITAASQVDDDLVENHQLLNDLCHSMDKSRPTVMAHAFMLEIDSPLIELADLASYNLYFGWYLGELEQNDGFFDDYHKKYPNRIIGFSEYGADANPIYQSNMPESGDYSEQYQCKYHEHILRCIEERPYLWATHVWNMFDFAADGRDEGGNNGKNQKGLITMDRQLKKDAFYLYKAMWSSEPFIHLCGRRYKERSEANTEIKIYSNASEVELYKDGNLVERKSGKGIFMFSVPITDQHKFVARSVDYPNLEDAITIQKVETANPSYSYGKKGNVINWFDKEDFCADYFSIKDTYGELMENNDTKPLVSNIMSMARDSRGDVAKSTAHNKNLEAMLAKMPFQSLIKKAGDAIPSTLVIELNESLQRIKK